MTKSKSKSTKTPAQLEADLAKKARAAFQKGFSRTRRDYTTYLGDADRAFSNAVKWGVGSPDYEAGCRAAWNLLKPGGNVELAIAKCAEYGLKLKGA